MKKITKFCFFLYFLSCTMNDNTRSYQLAKINKPKTSDQNKANSNKSVELIWEKPVLWIASEGSSMRIASFAIPYSDGSGDLSVIKLSGIGGGLEANVNRWRHQLNMESLTKIEIEKNIFSKEGMLGTFSIIQIINLELESSFLCAIIPSENFTIFVKLSIQPAGIQEVKDDFIKFCSSLNIPI